MSSYTYTDHDQMDKEQCITKNCWIIMCRLIGQRTQGLEKIK